MRQIITNPEDVAKKIKAMAYRDVMEMATELGDMFRDLLDQGESIKDHYVAEFILSWAEGFDESDESQ